MTSGSANLRYISRGMRTYGEKPVVAWPRGCWEFEFILKGRARPTGVECPATKANTPRLYVFHPDSPHGWTDEDHAYSEIFVIQFHQVPAELVATATPTKPILIELDDPDRRRVLARLDEVWEGSRSSSPRTSLKLHQLLVEMSLLAVGQQDDAPARSTPTDKVFRAINWFEEKLGENPTVEDAAKTVGVSAAHLRRLFAEAGRRSPQEELTRLRLDMAQRCLRAGWKQDAIAHFLGFSETSAFARAFRNDCGLPPGAWLANNK